MSGKLRVHELAKQLGVTSKELLATLKEQGEFVKTASSTIEPPVIKKMKAHYAKLNGGGADDNEKKEAPTPAKPPLKKPGQNRAKPAGPEAGRTEACSAEACGFRPEAGRT